MKTKNVTPSIYDDLLCRSSLEDAGGLPRTPPLEDSPDVIPSGTIPVADPQTYFTDTYIENVAKPVVANQQNYVYVRGKNLGDLAQNGEVTVYWAPQAQRNDPSVWRSHQLLTSEGHGSFPLVNIEPDAICVATTPFVWVPDPSLGEQEIAILAVLATNEHPNPIPTLKPPFDFDLWVARQGGIGTYLLSVQPPPKPPKTVITNAEFALTNAAGVVTFALRTSNIPLGSTVAFTSTEPDKDGNPIQAGPTQVNANPFVMSVDANVDANFKTRIHFELTLAAGQKPTADNFVGVSASQLPSGGTGPVKPVLLAQYNTQIKAPIATA